MRNNIVIKFIIILALVLRLIGINRGLWAEEIISINTLSNNPIFNPFYYNTTTNLPLYFYILKMVTFGGLITNTVFLRLVSIALNIINIFFVYKYFKVKNFAHINIFTAILITIAPLQIHYAQEIRPYALD